MAINVNSNSSSFYGSVPKTFDSASARLSSGQRINSAKDDAAGLAISNRISTQIGGYSTAIRNAGDGVSYAQTAGGALDSLNSNVQRIRELSVQASNGSLNDQDRKGIQQEISQLQDESRNILEKSNFNGSKLFSGENSKTFQVGPNQGDTVAVSNSDLKKTLEDSGIFSINVSTQAGASSGLDKLDSALESISSTAAEYGSVANRFESAINNLTVSRENAQASKSRVSDADFAEESSNLVKGRIQDQVGIAVRSQANARQQDVLRLLS